MSVAITRLGTVEGCRWLACSGACTLKLRHANHTKQGSGDAVPVFNLRCHEDTADVDHDVRAVAHLDGRPAAGHINRWPGLQDGSHWQLHFVPVQPATVRRARISFCSAAGTPDRQLSHLYSLMTRRCSIESAAMRMYCASRLMPPSPVGQHEAGVVAGQQGVHVCFCARQLGTAEPCSCFIPCAPVLAPPALTFIPIGSSFSFSSVSWLSC